MTCGTVGSPAGRMWAVSWRTWTGFFREGVNEPHEADRTARAKPQKPGVHILARYPLGPIWTEQGSGVWA